MSKFYVSNVKEEQFLGVIKGCNIILQKVCPQFPV